MEDGSVLPVLVQSRTGYANVCRLLTNAHLRSPKGESRVRWDELPEFAEGLIALTGDEEGPLVRALQDPSAVPSPFGRAEAQSEGSFLIRPSHCSPLACASSQKLLRIFGRERLYVELQRHHLRGEERVNKSLVHLAEHAQPSAARHQWRSLRDARTGRGVLDVFTCIRESHASGCRRNIARAKQRALSENARVR